MGVYCKVSVEGCWPQIGKAPIAVRWIDSNDDEHHLNYRSRLVAKEFETDIDPELYAATPPSECLRLLMNMLASQEARGDDVCGFVTCRRQPEGKVTRVREVAGRGVRGRR